jgi:hypothetical protein
VASTGTEAAFAFPGVALALSLLLLVFALSRQQKAHAPASATSSSPAAHPATPDPEPSTPGPTASTPSPAPPTDPSRPRDLTSVVVSDPSTPGSVIEQLQTQIQTNLEAEHPEWRGNIGAACSPLIGSTTANYRCGGGYGRSQTNWDVYVDPSTGQVAVTSSVQGGL